jgi:hypothetical protein
MHQQKHRTRVENTSRSAPSIHPARPSTCTTAGTVISPGLASKTLTAHFAKKQFFVPDQFVTVVKSIAICHTSKPHNSHSDSHSTKMVLSNPFSKTFEIRSTAIPTFRRAASDP